MTDIQELARKAGFIKQDMSLAHEAIEKNVYLVPSDSHLREFASLLREKFIAELEQTGWQFYQDGEWFNGSDKNNHKQNTIDGGYQVRELYALHKDKD